MKRYAQCVYDDKQSNDDSSIQEPIYEDDPFAQWVNNANADGYLDTVMSLCTTAITGMTDDLSRLESLPF